MEDIAVKDVSVPDSDLGAPETLPASAAPPQLSTKAIRAAITEKVRADCARTAAPIHVEDLGTLFPEMLPEEVVSHLEDLARLEENQDIKVMTSASGATYLYTTDVMSPETAGEKVLEQETCDAFAKAVRDATRDQVRLTATGSLAGLAPDLPPEQSRTFVTALVSSERYADIKQVVGPAGTYLYSETFMTGSYATLLARAEANDPYTTIAQTVRDESQLYPRPTKLALFYEPLFKIPEADMPVIVDTLLKRPEFGDIKKIEAPTGAIYLYSDKYMVPAAAERYVYWEEVERWTSM